MFSMGEEEEGCVCVCVYVLRVCGLDGGVVRIGPKHKKGTCSGRTGVGVVAAGGRQPHI